MLHEGEPKEKKLYRTIADHAAEMGKSSMLPASCDDGV